MDLTRHYLVGLVLGQISSTDVSTNNIYLAIHTLYLT